MIDPGDEINTMLWLVVALVSLVPFVIFLISYLRVRSKKLLMTTAAFFLFFIKASLLAMKVFIQNYDDNTIVSGWLGRV